MCMLTCVNVLVFVSVSTLMFVIVPVREISISRFPGSNDLVCVGWDEG